MRERSGEFWSHLRPLLLWNLKLVLAIVLSLVVVAIVLPAQSLAPLALVLGLAWLPGAVGTAYNLWMRRAGEPA